MVRKERKMSEKEVVRNMFDGMFQDGLLDNFSESEVIGNISIARHSWGENEGSGKQSKWKDKDTEDIKKWLRRKYKWQ